MQPSIVIINPAQANSQDSRGLLHHKRLAQLCWRLSFQAAHGPESWVILPSKHRCAGRACHAHCFQEGRKLLG